MNWGNQDLNISRFSLMKINRNNDQNKEAQ